MPAKRSRQFGGEGLFKEVRWEVLKVHFLLQLLNAAILFFALNIVLTLFNMSFWWSAGAALIFFLWRLTHGWRKSTLRKLEEGNPEVHEILRTAYEYRREESLMAQGLIYDLQRRLATVSAGVLIKPRDLAVKLIAIALLAFVPLAIISFTPFLIQENPLQDMNIAGVLPGRSTPDSFNDQFGTQLNESQDFFGDPDVAELGNEQLDVQVVSGGGRVSFESVSDPEDREFRYNDYPIDVDAEAAEASPQPTYSEDDVALINEYSCASKGAC